MTHEHPKVQRIAAWWHFGFCLLNLGALLYHAIAVKEHFMEAGKNASR